MSEFDPIVRIEGSAKLTSIFGYWPSFHDAEVIEMSLWRGDVNPDEDRYIFPVLTAKFHLWELTNEITPDGFLVLRKHTRATLRFHDVHDIQMAGFNHQNAIDGLSFGIEERGVYANGEPLPPFITVRFEPAFGVAASFKCFRAEVLSAESYSPEKNRSTEGAESTEG